MQREFSEVGEQLVAGGQPENRLAARPSPDHKPMSSCQPGTEIVSGQSIAQARCLAVACPAFEPRAFPCRSVSCLYFLPFPSRMPVMALTPLRTVYQKSRAMSRGKWL